MTDVIINKDEAIEANQDPYGKVWRHEPAPGTNLYHLVQVREDGTSKIPQHYPKDIQGLFTNINRCNQVLKQYLKGEWQKSEAAAIKTERKEHKEKAA